MDDRRPRAAPQAARWNRCASDYDFILIDCPPALSLLTLNALTAADSVLVPMQCEYYALEGLSALLDTIEALKARLNPKLEIEGVLRTMFDVRNNLANAVSAELTNHFGDQVFRTIVPRNVRLAEAPSHGQSIVGYDRASRGGVAYLGLAGEILRRQRERDRPARQAAITADPENAPRCTPAKKRGLGRGLEALLGPQGRRRRRRWKPQPGDTLRTLPVERCSRGKYQPRTHMDAGQADRAGRVDQGAGRDPADRRARDRRLAAARSRSSPANAAGAPRKQAGLAEVPVVVREVDDRTVVAMALIENIQREDLNPLEEAQCAAAPDRRIRPDPCRRPPKRWAARAPRCPTCCACWNCRRRSARCWKPRRLEMGHARALLTLAPDLASKLASRGGRARLVGARGRAPRPAVRRRQGARQRQAQAKPAKAAAAGRHRRAGDANCPSRSAPGSTSLHGRGGKGKPGDPLQRPGRAGRRAGKAARPGRLSPAGRFCPSFPRRRARASLRQSRTSSAPAFQGLSRR